MGHAQIMEKEFRKIILKNFLKDFFALKSAVANDPD